MSQIAATVTPPDQPAASPPPGDPARAFRRFERFTLVAFAVFWLAWMVLLFYIRIQHPGLDHGDPLPDANVLNAGKNFDAHGLGLNYGVPQWETYTDSRRPPRLYTHYPPLAYWTHQGLKALGLHELAHFRAFSLAISAAAVWLVLIFIAMVTHSRLLGVLGAFFYAWSIPFAEYADSMNMHGYMQFTLFGCLIAWVAYERAERRGRRALWLALALLLFITDCWLTFEHILLIGGFTFGRAVWIRSRPNWKGWLLIFLVPILVMGVRVVHNGMALGGVRASIDDLTAAAKFRAGGTSEKITLAALCDIWVARLGGDELPPEHHDVEMEYPALNPRLVRIAVLLSLVLICTWHYRQVRGPRLGIWNGLWLLACAIPWFVIMREGTFGHRHNILVLTPALALLLGSLASTGLLHAFVPRPRFAPIRWVAPLLALALMGTFAWRMKDSHVLNQVWDINPRLRESILFLRSSHQRIAAAGRRLNDVRRIVFLDRWRVPAYLADQPYQLMDCVQVPKSLVAGDVFWHQCWSAEEQELTFDALSRYGFPDQLSPPATRSLVFHGGRVPGLPLHLALDEQHELAAMHASRALDCPRWFVQCHLTGQIDKQWAEQLVFNCRLLDANGERVEAEETRVAWGIWNSEEALLWVSFAEADVARSSALRIGFWSDDQLAACRFAPSSGELPAGVELADDGRAVIWRRPPWLNAD